MPRSNSGKRKVATKKQKPEVPPTPGISSAPVSLGLALKLRELDRAMYSEFGCDMAYLVMGHGEVLAASDAMHGHMLASVKDEPSEGKVYTMAELWQCPENTKIVHPDLGIGIVTAEDRVTDRELDSTVVTFEGGERFVLPAPATVASPPPWDVPVKMTRPPDTPVNTAYSPG